MKSKMDEWVAIPIRIACMQLLRAKTAKYISHSASLIVKIKMRMSKGSYPDKLMCTCMKMTLK